MVLLLLSAHCFRMSVAGTKADEMKTKNKPTKYSGDTMAPSPENANDTISDEENLDKSVNTGRVKTWKILVWIIVLLILIYATLFFMEGYLRKNFKLPKNLIVNYYAFPPAKRGEMIKTSQFEYNTTHNYSSQGFRDSDFSTKNLNKDVILFIGDSMVEGTGVEANERFTDLLLEKLENKYTGINLGQLATNPNTYFDNLITAGFAFDPEIVVTTIFIGNDFIGAEKYKIPDTYEINKELTNPFEDPDSILEKMGFRYLNNLVKQVLAKQLILEPNTETEGTLWEQHYRRKVDKDFFTTRFGVTAEELNKYTATVNPTILEQVYSGRLTPGPLGALVQQKKGGDHETDGKISTLGIENTFWFVKEIDTAIKKRGKQSIFLIIPSVYQVHPRESEHILYEEYGFATIPEAIKQHNELLNTLKTLMEQENIQYLDATPALKQTDEVKYHLYDQHLNAAGHRVISGMLFDAINK